MSTVVRWCTPGVAKVTQLPLKTGNIAVVDIYPAGSVQPVLVP